MTRRQQTAETAEAEGIERDASGSHKLAEASTISANFRIRNMRTCGKLSRC
jgi:hypothetical protein